MTANTPATRKAKGRRFQQEIRNDLIERLGIDPTDILSIGMGQPGCDIYLSSASRERFRFGVECKHQEHWNIHDWWRQAKENAGKEELDPLLVMRRSRQEPVVMLDWSVFLEIMADRK